jgi:hypothetical protein
MKMAPSASGMDPMSTRVDRWLRDDIRAFGRRQREGPSEALRRIAREWWAMDRFPDIEFRDGVTGRRAGLRDGPDVWEVIMVWREYDPDREGLARHFGGRIPPEALGQALEYHRVFRDEIEALLDENRRLAERLGPLEPAP